MNLKSKNGKKVLRNASLIGAGMFILGAGMGVGISGTTSSFVQKPRIQKQGIVESSTKNISSSKSTRAVSSSESVPSSKLDTSSSIASSESSFSSSSSSSSSSETRKDDSNSNSGAEQAAAPSSTSMPPTAAVPKTYTVVRGDSLWSISQALHKSFAELLIKNPSVNPDHIEAGEVINL